MNYIVRVWLMKDWKCTTEYVEKDELIEAQMYAEKRATDAKAEGFEYDVAIYEITNL